MKRLMGFFGLGFAVLLSGCGAINTFTAAQLSSAEANAAQTVANKQKLDDMKLQAEVAGACDMNLGALQRNASNNPNAVTGILELCPLPNVGIVKVTNGQVQIQTVTTPNGNPFVPAASGVAK